MTPEHLQPWLNHRLDATELDGLPAPYRGKVRDNYDLGGGQRLIISTDRLSAFDRPLATIPFKGEVLTLTSQFWFAATADICPNHIVYSPDPNAVVVEQLAMLPVEMVVRDYLAGSTDTSILTKYKQGRRDMYGLSFPDGLCANEKLPATIITPTTKAGHGEHDAELRPDDILAQGLVTEAQWQAMSTYSLKLFERGRNVAAERGLILVDTKYEFGLDGEGRLVLGDELHTPDSSRFWDAATYAGCFAQERNPKSFDKDAVRRWVIATGCNPYTDDVPVIPDAIVLDTAAVYIDAFEKITGQCFVLPDSTEPPMARIQRNLAKLIAPAGP